MKKALFPIIVIFSFVGLSLTSCEIIEDFLSSGDATEALKEALRVGSDTAVSNGSKFNGYFANQAIKILLPEEADLILNAASFIPGVSGTLGQLEEKLNRAAENAAPQASEILLDAIVNITISDAINIVNGESDAATQYLRSATQTQIAGLFKPHIETSLETVGAQTIWENVSSAYNPIAPVLGQPQVNTDLADYTTNKALDGLFHLVAEEEGKIRADPAHRVSEILQQVFGGN
ncbi:MAG: DUF4197 domain-containing protein [Flavobacteriales bacterium]|nr:DUF4197 domain-containing protein [Flavobacteriales bacterium]